MICQQSFKLNGLALAPLTVEAAPLLAVSGGYHPVPTALLALCVLVVLPVGMLAVAGVPTRTSSVTGAEVAVKEVVAPLTSSSTTV